MVAVGAKRRNRFLTLHMQSKEKKCILPTDPYMICDSVIENFVEIKMNKLSVTN